MHELGWLVLVFLVTFVYNGLGTAIGYHRGISHRSFTCARWVEYFFAFGAELGFQGSPIWWTTIHRAHHKFADTETDSHSPRHGFKFWEYKWFLKPTYAQGMDPKKQCPDLYKDPLYRFLECDGDWVKAQWLNFGGIAVLSRLILIPFFGWQTAAVSLFASVLFFQFPLALNYICHLPKHGYRVFAVEDDSVNVWWMGLFWFGEGWHNNHHAFPAAARAGVQPHEFDLSWEILKLLKSVGLVYRLNNVKPEHIETLAARYAAKAVKTESNEVGLAGSVQEPMSVTMIVDDRAMSLT
jgi:fatty-acid desaturase